MRRPAPVKKKASKWPLFLILGMAFAGYFFFIRPTFFDDSPDMFAKLDYIELKDVSPKSVFIDSRPKAEFQKGSVPRAVNIPEDDFSAGYFRMMGDLIPGYQIVIFGDPMRIDVTEMTARKLLRKKVEGLRVYKGSPADLQKIVPK